MHRSITNNRLIQAGFILLLAACITLPRLGPRYGGPSHDATSGRILARLVGQALPDGAVVWADSAIERRPEVLLYAQSFAQEQNRRIRPLWRKAEITTNQMPPPGAFMLLCENERDQYAPAERDGFLVGHPDGQCPSVRVCACARRGA